MHSGGAASQLSKVFLCKSNMLSFVINDFHAVQGMNTSTQVVEEISAIDSGAAVSNPRIKMARVTTSIDYKGAV